jgi:PAS domain S-box-containing protein
MRILVVDDHHLVRKSICSVLATNPDLTICGEAVDGLEAVEKTRVLHPDVVVMDISMPNMNGVDATREIKRQSPETRVIIVSQHSSVEMIRETLDAGASEYVVKSEIFSDLIAAISRSRNRESSVKRAGSDNSLPDYGRTEILAPSAATNGSKSDIDEHPAPSANNAEEHFPRANPATEALSAAEQTGLLDLTFNAVMVRDRDDRITYWDKEAERLYGWTCDEAMGQQIHTLLQTEFPEPLDSITAHLHREHRWQGELVHTHKNGNKLRVISRWALQRSPDTDSESVLQVNFDVTQSKKVERELQLLVRTLEARIAERTRELENATDKLRQLSGRLLQTQDEERRRIARELHDGVGQLLAAFAINLGRIVAEKNKLSPDARRALDENADLIKQASQETRTMSHLLHPPLLDEVGLESALRWYIKGFSERSKIDVEVRLQEGFSEELTRDLALSLFRVVQECLTNVHRHSGGKHALVAITHSPENITLEVKDDGRGIARELRSTISSGENSGVGLRGMRERLRQFGGRMEVHSDHNGTRIIAVVPAPQLSAQTIAVTPVIPEDQEPALQPVAETYERDAFSILCIDDEPAGLLPRKLLLESAGHRVIEARSGAEGIRLFESEKVDAVILDYWMSGMKGTAVASELKRINPAVPIIVLSGMADLPGEAVGLVDQWFVKGSTRADELLNSIDALLDRRSV